MNYLLPRICKANPLLPLTQETKMRMTTTPLGGQLDKLERQVAALEQDLEKETVNALATRRINDGRRWKDDPAGTASDASTLDPSFGDEPDEVAETEREGKRHRFETMTAMIAQRDNVPLRVAATRARKEFPTLFADYQNSVGLKKTYEQLIDDEIRKGCTDTIARAKVAYAFPQAARESGESIAKSASVSEFVAAVDAIMKRDGCSRVAAMTAARKAHPDLYARFENVV